MLALELPLYHQHGTMDESGWNEQAEIDFVLQEEEDARMMNQRQHRHRLHLPSRERFRARHVPGALYMPALLYGW